MDSNTIKDDNDDDIGKDNCCDDNDDNGIYHRHHQCSYNYYCNLFFSSKTK